MKIETVLTFYNDNNLVEQMFFGDTISQEEPITYLNIKNSPIIYLTDAAITQKINKALNTVFG